jgi:methionyl-tRNA synthetase
MNLEGDKMSTSRGWSIEMHEYLEDFPDKPDVLRYCLLANLPENKDSEFTWKDFQARNNNELVAILGNFINRALVLTQKYFDNRVPQRSALNPVDEQVLSELKKIPDTIAQSIEQYRFREATAGLMDLARLGNKYLAETEPWKVYKSDPGRVGTILNIALHIVGSLAILGEAFLPFSSVKIYKMLNLQRTGWADAGSDSLLSAGHELGVAQLLFEKIEDDVIARQLKKLHDKKSAIDPVSPAVTPLKPEIAFDDFSKLDIRIGTVLAAEKMEKSNKLLKLTVDIGIERRTILSGIAQHFTPEELVGKQVTVLANLAPRKMMGVESQGMVLMVEDSSGKLHLLHPNNPVGSGAGVS